MRVSFVEKLTSYLSDAATTGSVDATETQEFERAEQERIFKLYDQAAWQGQILQSRVFPSGKVTCGPVGMVILCVVSQTLDFPWLCCKLPESI